MNETNHADGKIEVITVIVTAVDVNEAEWRARSQVEYSTGVQYDFQQNPEIRCTDWDGFDQSRTFRVTLVGKRRQRNRESLATYKNPRLRK